MDFWNLLALLVSLLWCCHSTGDGGTPLGETEIRVMLRQKGYVKKAGTSWFNRSLKEHVKYGKNTSQSELLLASFQIPPPPNFVSGCPL